MTSMVQQNERYEPSAYWQDQQDTNYTLYINGDVWARANLSTRRLTLTPQDAPLEYTSLVPPYMCLFATAEEFLQISKVDDIRAVDGNPIPEARHASETAAQAEGDARSPARWVREYARRAAASLKALEKGGDSPVEAREARETLTRIVSNIDPNETIGYARETLDPLEKARSQLHAVRREDFKEAIELCSRAIWIITYEDKRAFGRSWPPHEWMLRRSRRPENEIEEDVPMEVPSQAGGPHRDGRFQASRAARDREIERGHDDYERDRDW